MLSAPMKKAQPSLGFEPTDDERRSSLPVAAQAQPAVAGVDPTASSHSRAIALGAKCAECPLASQTPVYPNGPADATIAWVGEGPGHDEERQGRGFIGKSGRLLDKLAYEADVERERVWVTNGALCRPRSDDDKRKSIACCKPRLLNELASLPNLKAISAIGDLALHALTGASGITKRRGQLHLATIGDRQIPVVPTLHPAYLMRDENQKGSVVARDLAKARLVAEGCQPTPWHISREIDALFAILDSGAPVAFDVETTREHPTRAKLKSIAVATTSLAFVTAWPPEPLVLSTLKELFESERVKIAHNAAFDCVALARYGLAPVAPLVDTMILHHLAEPDHEHHLGWVASDLLLVEPWKVEFEEVEAEVYGYAGKRKALVEAEARKKEYVDALRWLLSTRAALRAAPSKEARKVWKSARTVKNHARKRYAQSANAERELARTQESLLTYNGKDAQSTARIYGPLLLRSEVNAAVRDVEMALLPIAIKMTQAGIAVDPEAREQVRIELLAREQAALASLREACGAEFDPLKPSDRRKLLYEIEKIPAQKFTAKTGQASTARDAILEYLDRPLIGALSEFDQAHKLRATFVENLMVEEDGRVHPTWTVGAQVTGRWTSKPNHQNVHGSLRKMYVAPNGRALAGCDMAQLEYRLVAALADCQPLLAIFNSGADVHSTVAAEIFGDLFTNEKDPKLKKAIRNLGKKVIHASDYGAGPDAIVLGIRRDPNTTLEVKRLASRERVAAILRAFEARYPEIPKFRQDRQERVRRDGYLRAEPLGRIRSFFDPESVPYTISSNWEIQTGATDCLNVAILKIAKALPKSAAIILNVHDFVGVECDAKDAEDVKGILVEGMRGKFLDRVMLEVEAKIGERWSDV